MSVAVRAEASPAEGMGEWIMFLLALAMLPIALVEEATSDATILDVAKYASAIIWYVFVTEYLVLLIRAPDRRGWIRGHWFDLLIIIVSPPIVPPEFEALRALRILRVFLILGIIGRAHHEIERFLRRDSLPYLGLLAAFVVFLGGLTIRTLEPDRIQSVGDGLWWAVVTAATVGYGDIAPVTFWGRLTAVVLMVVGLGTFAALTGAVSSLFVAREERPQDARLEAIETDLAAIRRAVERIGERIDPRS